MKRSGGRAGRPFAHLKIDELESQLKQSTSMEDLYSLRAELGYRATRRAKELQSLLDRLIRIKTNSFNPHVVDVTTVHPE